MQIIVDFNRARGNRPMMIIEQRYLWLALFVFTAVGAAFIYWAALTIASYWVTVNSPIVAEVVRSELQKDSANRHRLWEESVGRLQSDIAESNARLYELQERGQAIANYLGLPGEEMFITNDADTSDPSSAQCFGGALSVPSSNDDSTQPEDEASRVTSWKLKQDRMMGDLERKYALLVEEGIHRKVLNSTVPMKRPVLGRNWQTSGYGYRKDPFTGRRAFHAGVDYAARRGTPVVAGASGIVIFTGRLGNYGKVVQIYHGDNISTLYGHLHKIYVEQWQYVNREEIIASVGSTGRSTGPHLHYEVRLNNRPRPVFKTIREMNQKRFL